ncbi:DUF4097 domain-containing protein [Fulvivirga sp. M361]|uniref:DUF4097 family beta strand repeat-containing protein n=1 Tax=Fulvivirga sp. M361 TaxID=2594266 RepID=UPI00117AD9D7|nr:DUF4097 family beta strand repeat-containing protein [Fulvivirga sp. M361]TRX62143.1 DUF4097 domain-containing protein [Fulvivirga sp. M361]
MKVTLLFQFVFVALISFAQNKEFNLDKTYKIALEGKIEMSSDDADITIIGSNRKDVHVNIHHKVTAKRLTFGSEDFSVEVFSRNDDLIIQERSRANISVMGYISEIYTIDIEVPSSIGLDLKGDDDDYMIRNVDGDIVMRVDDGDAELSGCDGKDFYFSFDDGDVKMDRGSGKLVVKTDDGNVYIDRGDFDEIDARIDDGTMEIETALAKHGEYFFDANDATITLNITAGAGDFDIRHDDARVSFTRGFEVLVEEEDETRLKLGDGSAKVKIRADDGRVRLSEASEI